MSQIDILLGKGIVEQRRLAGVSQEMLAKKLGISLSTLYAIESGARRVEANLLFQMAELLGIELSQKLSGPLSEPFDPTSPSLPIEAENEALLAHYSALSGSHRVAIYAFLTASYSANEHPLS